MSKQRSANASYYRGGTSRAVIFQPKDLPKDRSQWGKIFLQVIGSPDPNGRQLDGMGGGVSSLSKICIVGPSNHPEADVDYTFVAMGIERDEVDFTGNCGNMSSAIGPYALNQGLLGTKKYESNGTAEVRIHNTNTGVIIRNTFQTVDGEAAVQGDFTIDGVGGSGARIQLDFLKPGGSKTGKLLPTGNAIDTILGFEVSCVDAANPAIFVRAEDLGVDPTILPNDFLKLPDKLALLDDIRHHGAVKMGVAKDIESCPRTIPKVAIVAPRGDQKVLSGKTVPGSELDLVVRFISDTQPHRAIPLTGALCTAAAAKTEGTVVQQCLKAPLVDDDMITIGHSSGRIQVNAQVDEKGDIESATVFRTARRIMEGKVFWNE
ncbi:DUF453 domain protein [Rhizodiscina lignyota]|uniref:DUF453 domain protein n=1 Tax=Rhizodiscina lignyota TaxID=1504668 RepID=A0A9P4II54_9PEZI|nr:DUF453 domain protein [Rhizodiscina lignyota]